MEFLQPLEKDLLAKSHGNITRLFPLQALEQQGAVLMELLDTAELHFEENFGFTAISQTGEVVTCGSVSLLGPWFLYFLTLQHGTVAENKVQVPCQDYSVSLLSLCVNNEEYLAVACKACHDIKLLDLKTKKIVSKAFIYMNKIQKICHGQPGRLFIFCGRDIFELDCSGLRFKQIQTIPAGINVCGNLCYIPSPYNLIVVSDRNCKEITAISTQTKKPVWTIDEIDGIEVRTSAFVFLPLKSALLVGGIDCMYVLDPVNGTLVQTIQLPGISGIHDLYFHRNQLFAIHGTERLSSFSVN